LILAKLIKHNIDNNTVVYYSLVWKEQFETMKYIVWPVAKNPVQGRFGPASLQDWYRGCALASKIQKILDKKGNTAKIAVVTATHITGHRSERDMMLWALRSTGVQEQHLILDGEAYETVGELEKVFGVARREKSRVVVVSTFGHYMRVAWLLWSTKNRGLVASHKIAFGLPRWRELVTDLILSAVFPIIDLLGGREWFKDKVVARRKSGRY